MTSRNVRINEMSLTRTTTKQTSKQKTPKHTKKQFRACHSFAQNPAVAPYSIQSKSRSLYHGYEALGIIITFQRVYLSSIPHPDWPTLVLSHWAVQAFLLHLKYGLLPA